MPPTDELPALAGSPQLLVATEHVSVGLAGVRVYRDGVEFVLERRLRRNDATYGKWQQLMAAFMEHGFPGGHSGPGRLRYGVELADGTRVFDSSFPPMTDPNTPPDGASIVRSGGSGGGGDNANFASNDGLWLYPLPAGNTMQLVMEWPAFDIPETRAWVAIDDLAELSRKAVPFWS